MGRTWHGTCSVAPLLVYHSHVEEIILCALLLLLLLMMMVMVMVMLLICAIGTLWHSWCGHEEGACLRWALTRGTYSSTTTDLHGAYCYWSTSKQVISVFVLVCVSIWVFFFCSVVCVSQQIFTKNEIIWMCVQKVNYPNKWETMPFWMNNYLVDWVIKLTNFNVSCLLAYCKVDPEFLQLC